MKKNKKSMSGFKKWINNVGETITGGASYERQTKDLDMATEAARRDMELQHQKSLDEAFVAKQNAKITSMYLEQSTILVGILVAGVVAFFVLR